jgi:hypothetical protein
MIPGTIEQFCRTSTLPRSGSRVRAPSPAPRKPQQMGAFCILVPQGNSRRGNKLEQIGGNRNLAPSIEGENRAGARRCDRHEGAACRACSRDRVYGAACGTSCAISATASDVSTPRARPSIEDRTMFWFICLGVSVLLAIHERRRIKRKALETVESSHDEQG